MIPRILLNIIDSESLKGKAIIILGARQTGKTTLLQEYCKNKRNVLWLNGDEPEVIATFENASSERLKAIIGNNNTVIIDEAQRIKNIGIKLKLITDQIKNVQLFATGSSAFELANEINEPLTGRKWEHHLFPVSFEEMVQHHGLLKEIQLIEHRLVFGYYPEIITATGNERELLKQLSDSYLYKDILMWKQIKKPDKLIHLLQALAFQVGSEVSYHELGKQLSMDNQTVEHYIQLLEQSYVIFRLGAFSRNLRKELKKTRKIYFYDNGIRNAIISAFSAFELRQDKGALWENFLISERIKHTHNHNIYCNRYFWRTHDRQEIDYIEERDGKLFAYEFKWNTKSKAKFPKTFTRSYAETETQLITPKNFEDFIS